MMYVYGNKMDPCFFFLFFTRGTILTKDAWAITNETGNFNFTKHYFHN